MLKRGLMIIGVVAFSFSAGAERISDIFSPQVARTVDSATLLGGLPVSGWSQTQTIRLDVAPLAFLTPAPAGNTSGAGIDPKDSPRDVAAVKSNPLYYTGEVGFMYGHSSGKFGGDEMATYMQGTVGNDKFQITAGASYEEWTGHNSRLRIH